MTSRNILGVDRQLPVNGAVAVVVNFESSSFLRVCLSNLRDSPVTQVLLWENGSSRSEKQRVDELARDFPFVTVISSNTNLGFGAAVNRAVEHISATRDVPLFLINPDTVDRGSAISTLLASLIENPTSIFAPRVVTGQLQRPKLWSDVGVILPRLGVALQRPITLPRSTSKGLACSEFVSAAFLLMNLSTFRGVGGFREDFFLYFEDTDFCIRATHIGYKIFVNRDAEVWHRVGGSNREGEKSREYHYYMQRNRLILFAKMLGFWNFILGPWPVFSLFLLLRASLDSDSLGKLTFGLKGVIDGLRLAKSQP